MTRISVALYGSAIVGQLLTYGTIVLRQAEVNNEVTIAYIFSAIAMVGIFTLLVVRTCLRCFVHRGAKGEAKDQESESFVEMD